MSILSILRRDRRASTPRSSKRAARYNPVLDCLEDRVVLSRASVAPAAPPAQVEQQQSVITEPLRITNILIENGQLIAVGQLAGQQFRSPVTLALAPDAEQPTDPEACPVLDLMLGPIELDLLGLQVETSEICLRITAEEGPGNLLGNLLCDIGGLLDDGLDLGNILGDLTGSQTRNLTGGLTRLLDGAIGGFSQVTGAAEADGECNILNLAVGPVDLNLLGLDVELDNCDGGPVTVDITAVRGEGNLLGNLLCGLVEGDLIDLDDLNLNRLNQLVRQATRFLSDGELSPNEIGRLTRTLSRLIG